MLGLPVVDADPVGRAVPEIEHSLFKIHGLPIAPQAVINEIGDTVIVTEVADDQRAEALVRALAVASRNLVWVADHALPWARVRPAVVEGALGLAQRVGEALRAARERGEDAAAAVAAAAGGRVVFRGRVTSFAWEERDGFTWGELELAGESADAGSAYRVWSKNENLLAWRDGVPDVTAPDLICCFRRDRRAGHQPASPGGRGRHRRRRAGRAAVAHPGRRGDARPAALRLRPRLRAVRGALRPGLTCRPHAVRAPRRRRPLPWAPRVSTSRAWRASRSQRRTSAGRCSLRRRRSLWMATAGGCVHISPQCVHSAGVCTPLRGRLKVHTSGRQVRTHFRGSGLPCRAG